MGRPRRASLPRRRPRRLRTTSKSSSWSRRPPPTSAASRTRSSPRPRKKRRSRPSPRRPSRARPIAARHRWSCGGESRRSSTVWRPSPSGAGTCRTRRPAASSTGSASGCAPSCRRSASRRATGRRVLVFTENREGTKRYLRNILEQAIAGTDRSDERIQVIDGLTQGARRKEVQRRFNADPVVDPLRILLATDAAREGLRLRGGIRHQDADRLKQAIEAADLDEVRRQITEEELEAARDRRDDDLTEQVERCRGLLERSRTWVGFEADPFRDALSCALELRGAAAPAPERTCVTGARASTSSTAT